MSESLLDDLQHVQLMVKEHHRRKRALEKLNKIKRHKFLKYSKYEECHKKKYNKYVNIYIEYEIKSIYDNSIELEVFEDYEIQDEYQTKEQKSEEKRKRKRNKKKSLSSWFKTIEHQFYNKNKNKNKKSVAFLKFPSKCNYYIRSLYDTSSENEHNINGLLKSIRYWNISTNIKGQAVMIGTNWNELINVLSENIDCPIDIIYIISELVGNPLIWLRKPGLNIFKWSCRNYEFFFSGYINNNNNINTYHTLKHLLNQYTNQCINYTQYLDLDWIFVIFILLGLIPKIKNQYFRWYFNQKLLSAIPGTYPFKLLLKNLKI